MNGRSAILATAACLAMGCERDAGSDGARKAPDPLATSAGARRVQPFGCIFTDITRASGLRFIHETGAHGGKLLPETMGSGAAFLDFDGDGALDIFLVNSTHWPGREPKDSPPAACALFRGNGKGAFDDVTRATGAGVSLYGMGCAPADYDGDGDEDIFITGVEKNVLLRNDGGTFSNATESAGLRCGRWKDRSGADHPAWSTAAIWADADGDGDLDLLAAGYVEWTPETDIFTTLDGSTKAFTTPDRYRGLPLRFYRNRGDGTFGDESEAWGIAGLEGKALGIAAWDFDENGLLDFVVANDTRPNFLLWNRGGRFDEQGIPAGIAYDETGRARAGMGIDIADYAQAGVPGVAIGNFAGEPMSLYRWTASGGFAQAAAAAGIAQATYAPLAFGVQFEDLDLDGSLDLVVVNGHIEPDIARTFKEERHAQSAQLFAGRGDGAFDDVSAAAGQDFIVPRVGRGLALGDVDGDGDLDILITVNGGHPILLQNNLAGAVSNHFVRVRLRGKGKNTRAIGAKVRLAAGGITQTRVSRTGSSYLSQSEPVLTFGLGGAATAGKIEVTWPSGVRTKHAVEADRTIEIKEE